MVLCADFRTAWSSYLIVIYCSLRMARGSVPRLSPVVHYHVVLNRAVMAHLRGGCARNRTASLLLLVCICRAGVCGASVSCTVRPALSLQLPASCSRFRCASGGCQRDGEGPRRPGASAASVQRGADSGAHALAPVLGVRPVRHRAPFRRRRQRAIPRRPRAARCVVM